MDSKVSQIELYEKEKVYLLAQIEIYKNLETEKIRKIIELAGDPNDIYDIGKNEKKIQSSSQTECKDTQTLNVLCQNFIKQRSDFSKYSAATVFGIVTLISL